MSVPETTENWNDCLYGYCPSFAGKPDFYCAKGKAEGRVEKRVVNAQNVQYGLNTA